MFTCPGCERTINPASEVCPYCGADLVPEPLVIARRKAQYKGLVMTLVAAVVLVGAIWAMVWLVLPKPDVPSHAEAEASAVGALRQLASTLAAYKGQEGTFPGTIEQVSNQAMPAFSMAHREGYSLLYRPGPIGNDGSIHSFVLLARPEYYGYSNFYMDQTGVIRSTQENREATVHDSPIS